jgi:hypothetical protein
MSFFGDITASVVSAAELYGILQRDTANYAHFENKVC